MMTSGWHGEVVSHVILGEMYGTYSGAPVWLTYIRKLWQADGG
jgi:hypothetical protein